MRVEVIHIPDAHTGELLQLRCSPRLTCIGSHATRLTFFRVHHNAGSGLNIAHFAFGQRYCRCQSLHRQARQQLAAKQRQVLKPDVVFTRQRQVSSDNNLRSRTVGIHAVERKPPDAVRLVETYEMKFQAGRSVLPGWKRSVDDCNGALGSRFLKYGTDRGGLKGEIANVSVLYGPCTSVAR
jgi:hypothetical protein